MVKTVLSGETFMGQNNHNIAFSERPTNLDSETMYLGVCTTYYNTTNLNRL